MAPELPLDLQAHLWRQSTLILKLNQIFWQEILVYFNYIFKYYRASF